MNRKTKITGLPVATPLPGGQQALVSLESEQTAGSLVVLYIQVIDPDVAGIGVFLCPLCPLLWSYRVRARRTAYIVRNRFLKKR